MKRLAVNSLWPKTMIATAAVENLLGGPSALAGCRHPSIVADAAHMIVTRPSRQSTGQFFIDEQVLREAGMTDFNRYAIDPTATLTPDIFLEI